MRPHPSSTTESRVTDAAPSFTFSIESRLRAPAGEVWAHATSFDGVNRELMPLARMTGTRSLRRLDQTTVVLGQRLFRSWILAFGIVPIDYDDLVLVELEPGRRFLERSTMLSQRLWEHERTVTPIPAGCVLRDRIGFVPRLPLVGHLELPLFRFVFANRHRQLRRAFGSVQD